MRTLNLLLFLILLSSCASIPDVIGCRQQSVNSGFCTYTLTQKSFIVDDAHPYNNSTWLDMKINSVYLPAESWAKIKEYILKECKKNNNCSQNINNWDTKLNSITP